ncbi:entericidin A/B family lipoprotein [Ruegeria marina]|uniref:Entericidin B n=1 Tax=Ruegeria marina TaxID=639004 RepID=A0A1G6RZY5_9RHOB|nr:entericidin A/B family lipoprotein [Ruegeria marina]SDD09506.1 entericidin B [Ruegeria marina]
MIRIVVIGVMLLTLAACETAKGAGRDIRKAGNAIENAATDLQKQF